MVHDILNVLFGVKKSLSFSSEHGVQKKKTKTTNRNRNYENQV